MDNDFFTDSQQQPQQDFQGYTQPSSDQLHQPQPHHHQPYQLTSNPIAINSELDYEQPQGVVDETLTKFRQQEEELLKKLRVKAEQQAELKRKRKEKGAKELEELNEKRNKQVEASRAAARENAKGPKNQNYKNEWEKIADNIALKSGDYPGTKDVSRMRQAILSKKQDQLQKK